MTSFDELHKALDDRAEAAVVQVTNINCETSATVSAIELVSLFDYIKSEQTSEVICDYKINEDNYKVMADAYFYIADKYPKLIVPEKLVKEIIEEVHKFGHFGYKKCLSLISKFYYWPHMHRDV